MTNSSELKKANWSLLLTCWVFYAIISMSKNAYSSSIAAIINDGLLNKPQAGFINSGFYLLYGTGQLLCGKFIDKSSPIKIITFIFAGTALSCLGMAISQSYISMLLTWTLCGLIQFAIWPLILKTLSDYLSPEFQLKAMTFIAFSYNSGMLVNYIFSSVILKVSAWRMIFVLNTIILVASTILWHILANKAAKTLKNAQKVEVKINTSFDKADTKVSLFKLIMSSGLLFLLISAFMRCCLDIGLKVWFPTLMMENYGTSPSFATALTTILLVVNLFGVFISTFLYPKRIKNVVTAFGLIFLMALPFIIGIIFIGKVSLWIILFFFIMFTTCLYAGHQFINMIIPSFFNRYNRVGTVAALLNATASFGSVVANFLFGYLSENFGWGSMIISCIVLTILAAVISFAASPIWKKFISK